jgi:hypothetical protein
MKRLMLAARSHRGSDRRFRRTHLLSLGGRKSRHHKCDIVTSNLVIGGDGGIWFGDMSL